MFKICIDCLSQKKFNDKEFKEIDEALCGKIKGGEINLLISGSKKEVMSKIKKLAEEEKIEEEKLKFNAKVERATIARGIWDALDDEEKVYVLAKAGYEF